MRIVGLFRSVEHIYFGHYGRSPGTAPMEELQSADVEAGRGIVGDRFHAEAAEKPGKKGQVTFFAEETWLRLGETLGRPTASPGVFRRNVIVRSADLNGLIGEEFEVQGVRFLGAEYCKPCFWMDRAFAPGTYAALEAWRAGGLRARALSGGRLVRDAG